MDELDLHIGKRLKQRRSELGFSRAELGKLLEFSQQQIREYERGLQSLKASTLHRISRKLQVEYSYFFLGFKCGVVYNCDSSAVTDEEIGKLIKIYRKIDDPETRSMLGNIAREVYRFSKIRKDYRLDDIQ
jgi:transcriptional regulator with XRE-family HTH domain